MGRKRRGPVPSCSSPAPPSATGTDEDTETQRGEVLAQKSQTQNQLPPARDSVLPALLVTHGENTHSWAAVRSLHVAMATLQPLTLLPKPQKPLA